MSMPSIDTFRKLSHYRVVLELFLDVARLRLAGPLPQRARTVYVGTTEIYRNPSIAGSNGHSMSERMNSPG